LKIHDAILTRGKRERARRTQLVRGRVRKKKKDDILRYLIIPFLTEEGKKKEDPRALRDEGKDGRREKSLEREDAKTLLDSL